MTAEQTEAFGYIKENLTDVRRRIAEAKKRAGRSRQITLVAVTKSASDEELLALCALGVADVGENRPQALARRGQLLGAAGYFPRLHEIGNLQENKVRAIADNVFLIHSLDRVALAEEIEKQAAKRDKTISVLVEINSAREAQKGGVLPEDALDFCERVTGFPHLRLCGMMTMGPVLSDPEAYRPYFSLTKKLCDEAARRFSISSPVLSMGMSDSFEVAIEEGATLVRIGRRLFEKPAQISESNIS